MKKNKKLIEANRIVNSTKFQCFLFSVKKELGSLAALIIGIVLFVIVAPFGLVYSVIGKPAYHAIRGEFKNAGIGLLKYFGNFIYQIWNVIKKLFWFCAVLIDLMANVFDGELIEDVITPMEDTMLGNGDPTISAAIGDIEIAAKKDPSKMNKNGWRIIRILNKFESNHCNKAIRLYKYTKKLKAED